MPAMNPNLNIFLIVSSVAMRRPRYGVTHLMRSAKIETLARGVPRVHTLIRVEICTYFRGVRVEFFSLL